MRTCPSCGAPSPATTQFCSACGKAFDGRPLAGVEYAGFGRRLGGYLIDFVIMALVGTVASIIVPSLAGTAISFAINFSYVVLLNANGGTVGKRILDMRLQNRETGENIGVGSAVLRYFVAIASGLALAIGYLWCIWDANKQTWHDKVAGSVVVKM